MDDPIKSMIGNIYSNFDTYGGINYQSLRSKYYIKTNTTIQGHVQPHTKYFKLSMQEVCDDIDASDITKDLDSRVLHKLFEQKLNTIKLRNEESSGSGFDDDFDEWISKPPKIEYKTDPINWTTKYCIGEIYQILNQMDLDVTILWFLCNRIQEREKRDILTTYEHTTLKGQLSIAELEKLESLREKHYTQGELDKSLQEFQLEKQSFEEDKRVLEEDIVSVKKEKETITEMNKFYKDKHNKRKTELTDYKQQLLDIAMELSENNDVNGCNQLINMGLFDIINKLNHIA